MDNAGENLRLNEKIKKEGLNMVMDIFFSSQKQRWDGIEIPIQTANSKLIDLDKINSKNKNIVDTFAIASSTMKILDAKYKQANLDA